MDQLNDVQDAPEEIRFAVVLNGGVSLAVWMGGVVREIDRATRGKGPYGPLPQLLDVKARADVIAGTSAGGINGAALALSQANAHADVGLMRDLWSEQGRMESLLQRPFKGSPASLLRGDDYFLPKLYEAMKQLCAGWTPTSLSAHPIELIITTTLLHGARIVTVDALGQQLPQMLHEGTFTFRRAEADGVLTPVIPLVAFAVEGWRSGDSTGRNHALAVAGTIVALALALMLLGSLPSQVRSPVSTLYRALDRLAQRFLGVAVSELQTPQRILLRLLVAVAWIVLVVLALAVAAAAVYGMVRLVEWIDANAVQWKNDRLLLITIAAAFVIVGLAIGYWTGWRLRSWSERSTASGGTVYQVSGVTHSSGVAATWSVIYGACYVIVAVGIIWWWPVQPSWVWRSALATAVVFSLLLLYVVPFAVLLGSVRAIRRRLVADARCAVIAWPANTANESEVVDLLWRLDMRFRCLLALSGGTLGLTGRGQALRRQVDSLLAEQ
ncbi:patatin-like phospholipase family protein [Kribbella sp. NBC_01510]|uniref:patatin-like phospholipase family protein n=1 Tax=Kribbella sp. NBC_01510 TaxID=2903581 RepID=UPI00386C4C38